MNEFKIYHPAVNFAYYAFVISFSMFFMNPILLVISFLSGFMYSVFAGGKKTLKSNLLVILPLMIITAAVNPLFNHQGVNILFYLPSGNAFTFEGALYGVAMSFMIGSVMCYFSSFNKVMSSDKFMHIFGKIMPSLALIFTMVLTFVPRFKKQLCAVSDAHKALGKSNEKTGFVRKVKSGIKIIWIMITWSLENAIDTSDSMKSRGYGLGKRTFFTNYKFTLRDCKVLLYMVFLAVYVIVGASVGALEFKYFPMIKFRQMDLYSLSVFVAYGGLTLCPVIIEIWEAAKWKLLKSKI